MAGVRSPERPLDTRIRAARSPPGRFPELPVQRGGSRPRATAMSLPEVGAAQAIDFLTLTQSLKVTKRTGWVRKEVAGPESIADHMYRMGLMALIAGDAGVDAARCMRLALVHDLAEAIVGDITPCDGVSKEEKNRLETDAMERIQAMLGGDTATGRSVRQLWQEYEDAATPEAQLVKDFDKVEMVLQAFEYEQAQGAQLQEFFDSTQGRFKTPLGRAWAGEVWARRQAAQQQQQQQQQQQTEE